MISIPSSHKRRLRMPRRLLSVSNPKIGIFIQHFYGRIFFQIPEFFQKPFDKLLIPFDICRIVGENVDGAKFEVML